MLKGRVLITGESVADRFLKQLEAAGLEVSNPPESYPPSVLDETALISELENCVAYLVGGDEWASHDVLAAARNLKIIAFLGVGYQSFVDAEAAAKLSIPVTNTPGTLANSVAEFTIGHLINERRRLSDYAQSYKTGSELAQEKRSDIFGHRIGIVGLGSIGTRIAEILKQGFNADVVYFSRSRKPELEANFGLHYLELSELVATVESLIVMTNHTDETTNLINDDVLAARPIELPGLHLINIAKAEIADPGAILRGLESGRIESVAIDGYYHDSSPHIDELKKHPRVTITPHIASLTHDARDAMSQMSVDSILRVLSGEPDPNIVNRGTS